MTCTTVAGLAETFPSFSVSYPFLLDFPGFQVPSDSIVPPQLWFSSRALPLYLHFRNCSDAFPFFSMTVYSTHCRYMMENNSTFIMKCKHTQWLDNSQLSVAIRVGSIRIGKECVN